MLLKYKENAKNSKEQPIKIVSMKQYVISSHKNNRTLFGSITGITQNGLFSPKIKQKVKIPKLLNNSRSILSQKNIHALKSTTEKILKTQEKDSVSPEKIISANIVPAMKVVHKARDYIKNSYYKLEHSQSPSHIHNNPLACKMKGAGKIYSKDALTLSPHKKNCEKYILKGYLEKQCSNKTEYKQKFCILKKSVFAYSRKEHDEKIQCSINFSYIKCKLINNASCGFEYFSQFLQLQK